MFYLTLPSNSSMDYYPENTASHFYTKLPQDVTLSGDYEVGLSEIQLSNTYFNIEDGDCYFTYLIPNTSKKEGDPPENESSASVTPTALSVRPSEPDYKGPLAKTVIVPGGLYESNDFFIHQLSVMTKNEVGIQENGKSRLKFYYNRASKKVSLTIYEKDGVLRLSQSLQRILSLPSGIFTGPGSFVSKFSMDLNEDFKSVYVYCDLVSPRMVGDTMAPLLRIVPLSERKAQIVYHMYEKPHYVPLSRFQFNSLEILLTTDKGRPISFTSGSTVVTLHFRRKRPENY